MTGTPGSRRASGGPPCETSATRFPDGSSKPASGTRKIAPAEARSAFGPVGSAQPRDSATDAPNASAARRIVPRFPGSATRQSESESGSTPRGSDSCRKRPITRGGYPIVDTFASSSGSTSSPARSTSTGSTPASSAAWTRSSPSTTKSPSFSRWRRDSSSRWISRSFGLWADVITAPTAARSRGSQRGRRTRAPRRASRRVAGPSNAPPSRGLPVEMNASRRFAPASSSTARTRARPSSPM